MKIHLVSATRSPVRLVVDGRELRQLHGPFDMFRDTAGAILLDEVSTVKVVAPYNPPGRQIVCFLFGVAVGLLLISLGIDVAVLRVAASLPLALAIVLLIIPSGVTSNRVLTRVVAEGRPYMLAMPREDLSTFRSELPDAEWKDEEEGLGVRPLSTKERLRLKLMQVGLVMTIVSACSAATMWLQHQTDRMPDGMQARTLGGLLIATEMVALVLFIACWTVIVRIGMSARSPRS